MEELTTGQLAKRAQVNIETIRFYERKGLLPKPRRNSSGYRIYSQDSVNHIKFIKRAKTLGFFLKEISELLSLRVDSKKTCGHVKKQTETKLDEINKKIKSLRRIQKALKNMSKSCQGKGPISKCPILDELNK